jgi:hypothetical protein
MRFVWDIYGSNPCGVAVFTLLLRFTEICKFRNGTENKISIKSNLPLDNPCYYCNKGNHGDQDDGNKVNDGKHW